MYAKLLNRDRRLRDDPWLGEWLHGRAVATSGVHAVILGPSVQEMEGNRDSTDLPVRVAEERALYKAYGLRFEWPVFVNEHTKEGAEEVAYTLYHLAASAAAHGVLPPSYCGPAYADVVIVGARRNDTTPKPIPGAWLPFTSRYTEKYGRVLGDMAFECGWTNAYDGPRDPVANAKLVIACGSDAWRWSIKTARAGSVVKLPHPASLYRWGNQRGDIPRVESALLEAVSSVINSRRYDSVPNQPEQQGINSGSRPAAGVV